MSRASKRKQKNKNRHNKKTNSQGVMNKATDLGSWSPLAPWIDNMTTLNLSRTKWSAAQSYIVIGYIEKCVELIASGITSLPYSIKRFNKGDGSGGD